MKLIIAVTVMAGAIFAAPFDDKGFNNTTINPYNDTLLPRMKEHWDNTPSIDGVPFRPHRLKEPDPAYIDRSGRPFCVEVEIYPNFMCCSGREGRHHFDCEPGRNLFPILIVRFG